jgi:hypothetical protein
LGGPVPKTLSITFAAFGNTGREFPVKLRTIRSRADLIAVLRERQTELNISLGTIDAVAGIADGYASKCLSLTPTKQMGPVALGAILGALGLGIVEIKVDEDPQAAAAVSGRWTPRRRRSSRRDSAFWCVVTDSSELQPSFQFENPDREQSPDVDDQPADHDAR